MDRGVVPLAVLFPFSYRFPNDAEWNCDEHILSISRDQITLDGKEILYSVDSARLEYVCGAGKIIIEIYWGST